MSEENQSDFKVKDRRHFDQDGNVLDTEKEKKPASEDKTDPEPQSATAPPPSSTAMPKIDFISLLFSYIHTAIVHLGDAPDPVSGKQNENLEGAQQMIDILEVLEQKTKGNLTPDEERYLNSALFDLRMRYLHKSKLIR